MAPFYIAFKADTSEKGDEFSNVVWTKKLPFVLWKYRKKSSFVKRLWK